MGRVAILIYLFWTLRLLQPTVASRQECGSDQWDVNEGQCIRLYKDRLKYSSADTFCKNQGASLVNIENSDKMTYIDVTMDLERVSSAWIGLYKHNGHWKWADGRDYQ